jgi:hypothetical protein
MDTEEPTDIREFLPEGATAEMVTEPQQDMTPIALQLLGQKDLELAVAQVQIAQLRQQVELLHRRLAKKEEGKKG